MFTALIWEGLSFRRSDTLWPIETPIKSHLRAFSSISSLIAKAFIRFISSKLKVCIWRSFEGLEKELMYFKWGLIVKPFFSASVAMVFKIFICWPALLTEYLLFLWKRFLYIVVSVVLDRSCYMLNLVSCYFMLNCNKIIDKYSEETPFSYSKFTFFYVKFNKNININYWFTICYIKNDYGL